jgi:hypothetical protein
MAKTPEMADHTSIKIRAMKATLKSIHSLFYKGWELKWKVGLR